MKRLARATVAAVTVLGLGVPSIVSAATTISTSGPSSPVVVSDVATDVTSLQNKNHVSVHTDTDQHAYTGDANVSGNTTGGAASTGAASNNSTTSASVAISNPSSLALGGSGGVGNQTVTTQGPSSPVTVSAVSTMTTTVENDNHIYVNTDTDQHASTGDANVSGNTTGGSATTGSASNTSSSTFTLVVTN